jgi:hypothetical protein
MITDFLPKELVNQPADKPADGKSDKKAADPDEDAVSALLV